MANKEYGPDYWAQPDDAWQSKSDRGQGRYGADRYHDNSRYDDSRPDGDGNRYGNDADRYGDDSARYGNDDERYGTDRDRYGNDEDYHRSDPSHPAGQTVKPAFRQAASAIVTVVVVIFVAAIGVQVWRTWSRSSGSTGASSSSSVQDDSRRFSDNSMADAVSYEAWDRITVGTGTAGATKAEAEKILGRKADNSTTSTVKGVKIERLRWNGVKGGTSSYSRVNVEFQDDHAVLKSAYGLVTNRPHEITLAQYQKIASGQGKKDVEAIVGRPDSVTVINYGTPWESWTYSIDVKGGTTASFRVVFKNGVVSTTTQSDMR